MQIRHGDLLLESVPQLPTGATRKATFVLAEGETTGHAHRLEGAGAAVLERETETYASAPRGATITHEEHRTVVLPAGNYRIVPQVEHDPYRRTARRVVD